MVEKKEISICIGRVSAERGRQNEISASLKVKKAQTSSTVDVLPA